MSKRTISIIAILIVLIFAVSIIFISLNKSSNTSKKEESIAVFVPGIISGSPVYEMLVDGVTSAISEYNNQNNKAININVLEAGTNQAEWSGKITALAATGKYKLIISSNPSLPDLILPLVEQFPKVKFLILDSYCMGNESIATIRYNQREQAYIAGYAAALTTSAPSTEMKYSKTSKKIAIIAAQEYPVMNQIILPSFTEGAKAVDKDIKVEFRVVGNWYDATKGDEIARSLYREGVDVILPIAGGASQGVIAAAKDLGFYIVWFDDNGFSKAPGYVVASTALEQQTMAYNVTKKYLNNQINFGTAETVGIKEGYVKLITDDALYTQTVSERIRNLLEEQYQKILKGDLELPSLK